MRDLSTIRAEIEQARPLARAEQAFAAAAGKGTKNPWVGSTERLAALESELSDAELRAEGEALIVALDALAPIDREERTAREAAQEASAGLAELERHPVIARWLAAPQHAMRLAVLQRWEEYAAWFISLRGPRERRPTEYAPQAWPSEVRGCVAGVWPEPLRFDEVRDREIVHAWLAARSRAWSLGLEAQGISARRASILAQYPVLRGIELPKRARSAA